MRIKSLTFIGFLLAALVGLVGASDCPHAEAAGLAAMTGHAADTHADGEQHCHHDRQPTEHDAAAWVRPAQPLLSAASAARTHPALVPPFPDLPSAADAGRPPLPSIRDGTAGFAAIHARTGRLLI